MGGFNTSYDTPSVNFSSGSKAHQTSHDLHYPVLVALIFFLIRFLIERFCFIPSGNNQDVNICRCKEVNHNDLLEGTYRRGRGERLTHGAVVSLARELDWSERQVERWLRQRRAMDRATNLTKFTENGSFLTYDSAEVVFGSYVLWHKPWLKNVEKCWSVNIFPGWSSDIWSILATPALYLVITLALLVGVRRFSPGWVNLLWSMLFLYTLCRSTILNE